MPKPILTVAIPAYNVATFIEKTIFSLTQSKYLDKIEILVINDGSSDNTAEIVNNIIKKYSCVKIINKTNGGHGSSINTGIEKANGKYFRLLDGDDWFDTDEFDQYIEKLLLENTDLILTDYVECFSKSNIKRPVSYYSSLSEYQLLNLNEVNFPEWGPTLPTTTIKTKLLKNFKFKIDEHCFYVDQEYNLACYLCAKTVKYYPFFIYQYRLEREGQSMEKASLIRNVYSHEKVCIRLLSEYTKHLDDISAIQKNYLLSRVIIPMCHMQYEITTDFCKSRKAFLSFDKKIKTYKSPYNNPNIAGNITIFHRKTHAFFVPFNDIIKKISIYISKFPKNRVLRFPIIFTGLFSIILAIILKLSFSVNPFIVLLFGLATIFLFYTNLHRIPNYPTLGLIMSIILILNPSFYPFVLIFYVFVFLYMFCLNIIKFKYTKTMLIKNTKMAIKLCISAMMPSIAYLVNILLS